MKTPWPRQRKDSLTKRLAGYSSTAGAALLCATGAEIALPTKAPAAITNVTSITPVTSGTFHSSGVDMIFNGGPFQLDFFGNNALTGGFAYVKWVSGGNSAVKIAATTTGTNPLALRMIPHVAPLENQIFNGSAIVGSADPSPHGIAQSGASAGTSGYIGFKEIFSPGHTSYLWLRVRMDNSSMGLPTKFSLTPDLDGIYGAYAPKGDGLLAGETAGTVPEPSTIALDGLALIAIGAMGVRELRRRRAAGAA